MRTISDLLELVGISKDFGGVQALRDVDLTLGAGEIHGLVGENGAGKSTLMKIIAGVHTSYAGTMRIEGRPVRFRSTRDALAAGIGMVHQELSVAPDLSVAENVFLGSPRLNRLGLVDWSGMYRDAAAQLRDLGLDIDTRLPLGEFPIGIQQLVELSRVLFSGARIIILDEPTSALSPPETERLFGVLRKLRAGGRSIVFISHFLDDVLRISDRITIFRNSRKVVTTAVDAAIDKAWIIERMIGSGHEGLEESWLGEIQLASPVDAPAVLAVTDLSLGTSFSDISLEVRSGEVLGIYGFMGSGQVELARSLFGKLRPDRGAISVAGRAARLRGTSHARRVGIALVPESRRAMLFADEPIYKNISVSILETLSRLWLKPNRERQIAADHIKALSIRASGADARLGSLSGGNQQKVALARWLTRVPRVLVLSEPTRGMDVGAKDDVVQIVKALKARGLGIVVVSTEPETVLSMADRILVMKRGRIVGEFANQTITKDRLLAAA